MESPFRIVHIKDDATESEFGGVFCRYCDKRFVVWKSEEQAKEMTDKLSPWWFGLVGAAHSLECPVKWE